MGRTARDKRDRPHPPPVEHIELNDEHAGWRLIAAGVLLVFGAAMLVYAFMQLMSPEDGWMEIEASSSAGTSCAGEFTFLYYPDGTAERKAVSTLYTQLCRSAYELFHCEEEFEGVSNVCTINRHPNVVVELDPGLYAAFETVAQSGSRLLYLGPVYGRYDDLFFCTDDSQTVDFDPRLSEDVAREYGDIAAFASDPGAIGLELLGENRVRLAVSEEYLAYAAQEEIEDFIRFSWTTNAFIADYIARGMTAQGFTRGVLTSYDGFVRNLDGSGMEYSVQLYDRQGQMVYPAAVMSCPGPVSIVSLRDYPLNELDQQRFYELSNGEIRTLYLDLADGLCRNAVPNLVCYAGEKGCGELLLALAPVYIAESFQEEALTHLAADGIQSIYFKNGVICPSEPGVTLTQLYEKDGVRYTVASAEK